MSENGTVQFMFRMALNSYSRIGNNIRLVLSKVGFSVNQIRCISPATMRKYLYAECFIHVKKMTYKLVLKSENLFYREIQWKNGF